MDRVSSTSLCLGEDHRLTECPVCGVGVGDGETGVTVCIGGNVSQGLDGPLSLFRMLNKAKTKQRLQH